MKEFLIGLMFGSLVVLNINFYKLIKRVEDLEQLPKAEQPMKESGYKKLNDSAHITIETDSVLYTQTVDQTEPGIIIMPGGSFTDSIIFLPDPPRAKKRKTNPE